MVSFRRKCKTAFCMWAVCLLSLLLLTGCAGFGQKLKAFLGGGESKPSQAAIASVPKENRTIRFSENPNVQFNSRRQYKRMTKEKFEEQADLNSDAGSLWVSEGQGAYWFSQNQMRMVGDLLNVKVTGAAKEQLETKVKIIKKLLQKLDRPEPSAFRKLASTSKNKKADDSAKGKDEKTAEGGEGEEAGEEEQAAAPTPFPQRPGAREPDGTLPVNNVPTRIVEKLVDGSYRVQGGQPFMIGKREYKVIVTGIIRAEDFNEEGVDTSKIMDPKYDIVSNRRSLVQ